MLKEKFKKELISLIHKHIPDTKIYPFGSRAQDEEGPGSDIDLALDSGAAIPYTLLSQLLNSIEASTIPMEVDIVDLNNVSEDFKKAVSGEAIP